MWCKLCGQDVPALVARDGRKHVCPRCRSELSAHTAASDAQPADVGRCGDTIVKRSAYRVQSLVPMADWQLESQERHTERVLASARAAIRSIPDPNRSMPLLPLEMVRNDMARVHSSALDDRSPINRASLRNEHAASHGQTGGGASLAFALGTICFCCGLVLVGWSSVDSRPELTRLGTPILLAGQIGLLIGIALQIVRFLKRGERLDRSPVGVERGQSRGLA